MGVPASYQGHQGYRIQSGACMHVVMALVVLAAAAFQDRSQQDDVIQLKGDGGLLVGKVTDITDTTVEMTLKDGNKKVTLDITQIHPTSVYRIKAARIDPKSADAHWALGDFCKANKLYAFAGEEYDKAAALDSGLKDKAKKLKDEMRGEDA